MPSRQPLRLQLTTTGPPAKHCDGRPTKFGLQDRSERLTDGVEGADGQLTFALDLEVSRDPTTDRVSFHSPFVHGPAGAKFLYLGWRYCDGAGEWIRRQKLPLAPLAWEQIGAEAESPRTFAAEVPPIMVRCATVPVAWRRIADGRAE